MNRNHRIVVWSLLVALVALLSSGAPARAAADPSVAHVDGYVSINPSPDGRETCVILRQHDGSLYALSGRVIGLLAGDHVRLEGRAGLNRCGAQGFEVSKVQTVWADDNHRSTYYDHLHDGGFRAWAARNNRVHGEPEWGRYYPPGR
jgi:hypothetical protein